MTATTNRAQWERFASYVATGHSYTESAILTGYAENSAQVRGSELMALPQVRELVEQKRLQLKAQTDWTAVRVIQALAETAKRAADDGQHAVSRACYRDIGEHIGMWPRQPIKVDARQQHLNVLSELDEQTLRAIASASTVQDIDASDDTD